MLLFSNSSIWLIVIPSLLRPYSPVLMSIIDSEAQFEARAQELGLSPDCLQALHTKGVHTLGQLAFALGPTPGETKPEEVQAFLSKLAACTETDALIVQRLIFEAQTLLVASLKAQVEQSSSSAAESAKHLPPLERQARIDRQKERLVGLHIAGESEPSHELIDLCFSMFESKAIRYIPPHRCTKRDLEIQEGLHAKDKDVLILEKGALKTSSKQLPNAPTNDGLRLYHCLLRRALALDLAGLVTFSVSDKYHQHLLAQLSMSPPSGFDAPSISQIVQADKHFWARLSERAGTTIRPDKDNKKPLDKLFPEVAYAPEISFHLLPRPRSDASATSPPDRPRGKGAPQAHPYRPKGKGKQSSKSRGKGFDPSIRGPSGKGQISMPSWPKRQDPGRGTYLL